MLRLLSNVLGEIAVEIVIRGDNLAAVERCRVALPVGDCAAGFFDQQQSGGDVPGVDEAVVVEADAPGSHRQVRVPVSRLLQGKLTHALLTSSFSE